MVGSSVTSRGYYCTYRTYSTTHQTDERSPPVGRRTVLYRTLYSWEARNTRSAFPAVAALRYTYNNISPETLDGLHSIFYFKTFRLVEMTPSPNIDNNNSVLLKQEEETSTTKLDEEDSLFGDAPADNDDEDTSTHSNTAGHGTEDGSTNEAGPASGVTSFKEEESSLLLEEKKTQEDLPAPSATPSGDSAASQINISQMTIPRKSKPNQNGPSSAIVGSLLVSPSSVSSTNAFGLPESVIVPSSVTPDIFQGKLLSMLKELPPNLIHDALQEFHDAIATKGESIRNRGAYLNGVVRRYRLVQQRSVAGEGKQILPMGEQISPRVVEKLDLLVATGYCTQEEMNDKIKCKIKMLSEQHALLAIEELSSVERSSIRNFGSYFMGILNRYMRGDLQQKNRRPSHSSSDRNERHFRDSHLQQQHIRDRSRERNPSAFPPPNHNVPYSHLPPPPPPPPALQPSYYNPPQPLSHYPNAGAPSPHAMRMTHPSLPPYAVASGGPPLPPSIGHPPTNMNYPPPPSSYQTTIPPPSNNALSNLDDIMGLAERAAQALGNKPSAPISSPPPPSFSAFPPPVNNISHHPYGGPPPPSSYSPPHLNHAPPASRRSTAKLEELPMNVQLAVRVSFLYCCVSVMMMICTRRSFLYWGRFSLSHTHKFRFAESSGDRSDQWPLG